MGGRAASAVRRLCRGQADAERARLRRPAALLGADDGRARAWRRDIGGRFDHVLVDEYQDTNRLQAVDPAGAEARRPRPDRGRRRRPVDLLLSRRDGAQHPRLSRASSRRRPTIITLERNYRSTQPILDAANAVIDLARRALHQEPLDRAPSGERPRLVTVRDEADQARYVVERVLEHREARHGAEAAGGAVPHVAPQRRRSRSS